MNKRVSAASSLITAVIVLCSTALASQVKIVTQTLPNGNVNTAYSATITTSGGSTPFVWWVSRGSMPPGLSLAPTAKTRNAVVSGTPSAAGSYQFSVSVTGRGGHTSTASYTITIQGPVEHVVDLSWMASPGDDVLGYNVYRSNIYGGPYDQINASLVATTIYCDSTVVDGATYYYVVTAVDRAGAQSGYSGEAVAQIPGD